jgi:hypothetical protein
MIYRFLKILLLYLYIPFYLQSVLVNWKLREEEVKGTSQKEEQGVRLVFYDTRCR